MHKQIISRPFSLEGCQFPSNISPLMARLYSARGIRTAHQLNRQLGNLPHYRQLKDIDKAATILAEAIMAGQRLLIVADFDCDGATSCAVAMLALRALGGQVDYLVPNRFEYGYGLTPEIVALTDNRPADVLITVDNGISSLAGVKAARARGMKVVITDHHLAGEQLPEADAIVNPNQPGCDFPGKNTAGVGIIFFVICALRARLGECGWFSHRPEPNLAQLLDLVALGTVADVVSLDYSNRILVHQGLARIRAGRCRPGIRALAEVAGRNLARLCAADLGFALAPRLNAAGRLDDMTQGIELLLSESDSQARVLAGELDNLNRERRAIEASMHSEALAELAQLNLDQQRSPWGIALFKPDWHQGVIGILASRVKDRLNRPVIAFADAGEGLLKGSARSITGLHIRDTLDTVARLHPGLIISFGGHAMAAGLSIAAAQLPLFKSAFDQAVKSRLSPEDFQAILFTDGILPAPELTLATAETIRDGGPWGQQFPEPCFEGRFQIMQQRLVGQKHLKLVLQVPGSDHWLDAIAFNIDPKLWPNPQINELDVVYTLDINEYRGQRNLQLRIDHLQPVPAPVHTATPG